MNIRFTGRAHNLTNPYIYQVLDDDFEDYSGQKCICYDWMKNW